MKLLIAFFALIGVSNALVPGMEYEYQYEGQTKIGVPEIRNKVAGTGIRCRVQVQVQDSENVAIKLVDVEVGEVVNEVKCELRDHLDMDYQKITGHATLLQKTFMIHPAKSKGEVMETTNSEEVWLANVKRSIASLFIVEPIRKNFGSVSPDFMEISSHGHSTVEEPSIFGRCTSDYSMVPLNNTYGSSAVSDQGPVYAHRWTNYEMSRTINFDDCKDSVHTKQFSMGNGSTSHLTQFGDVQSRHSVMRHNLTYDGEYYILQNGTNEGHFSVNPFGMSSEKIVSISNQTYHLVSVKKMGEKWTVESPTRILDTWCMELSSAFSPGPKSPDWIRFQYINDARYEPFSEEQFWTGINVYNYLDKMRVSLNNSFDLAADIILREETPSKDHNIGALTSDSAKLTSHLEFALRCCRALTQQDLQNQFDNYYQDQSEKTQLKLRLLIDTLAASGAGAPLKVLIDNAQGGKISPQRAASVFFSLPNNLIATPLIKEMEAYVKSLSLDSYPYTTAIIWSNYARIINKACIDVRSNYTVPYKLFGKEHCNEEEATHSFLPFLEQILENSDEEWKKIIVIHAIGNIGSRLGYSVLESIVQDQRQASNVRVAAVYALSHRNLDMRRREYALKTLMSVSENRTDCIFVRQACILATLSWRPPRSWYQTLASSSWIENSNQMSSFIYFILKSYAQSSDPAIAEQAQVARFFLPLAKAYAPSSRYSYASLLSIYDTKLDLVTDFHVSSLRAGRYSDSIQRQVIAVLINSFGGHRFSVAQSSLSYDPREVSALLQKLTRPMTQGGKRDRKDMKPSPKRRMQLALQDVQERMVPKQSDSNSLATYFFSMFEDMEILVPLNMESLSKAFRKDGALLLKELEDDTIKYTKFINPGIISLAVPSELGIPLISRLSIPTFVGGPVRNQTLTADGHKSDNIYQLVRAKDIRYDVNINFRFASKALTTVRVLMPWTTRTAMASVEAVKSINLPVKFSLRINREDVMNNNVSVAVIPTYNAEFTVGEFQTVPSLTLKDIFPTEPSVEEVKTEAICQRGQGTGVEYAHIPINESFTGISGYWRYEGDVSNPFNEGNCLKLLREPNLIPSLMTSPTSRMLRGSLIIDPSNSKTKEIHSSIALRLDTSKPRSPKGDLPDFEFRSTLLFNGSETRYFETDIMHSEQSSSGSRHTTILEIDYKRSQLPRFDSNPAGYCLNITKDGPKIKSFEDLRKALESSENSEVNYKANLTGGSGAKACDEKHIASLNGSLKISDERRNNLSQELNSVCSYDPNNPTVEFVTAPVYDRLNLDISYQEPIPRALQNATYHAYDVMRGWTFPHVYFDYMDQDHNPKDKISIRGDRYLSERRWKLEAKMPKETSKLDNFKMPSVIENIVPYVGIDPNLEKRFDSPRMLLEAKLSNECTVTKKKIRVFDGYTYSYASEYCDTTVVEDSRDFQRPTLMTGIELETKHFKALVGFFNPGATVSVKNGITAINGRVVGLTDQLQPLIASNGQYLCEALRTRDYTQVIVPGNFSLKVYDDKVVVTPYENMAGYYRGLCGGYDGAKHPELIGPLRCIYTNPQLFGYAWTSMDGAGCEYAHYKDIKAKVHKFQKHCEKVPVDRDN